MRQLPWLPAESPLPWAGACNKMEITLHQEASILQSVSYNFNPQTPFHLFIYFPAVAKRPAPAYLRVCQACRVSMLLSCRLLGHQKQQHGSCSHPCAADKVRWTKIVA